MLGYRGGPRNSLAPLPRAITPDCEMAFGGAGARALQGAAWASQAWPGANLVILFPFTLHEAALFRSLFSVNGSAAAAGNVDVGVYGDGGGSSTLDRIVSTGPKPQSGATAGMPLKTAVDFILPAGDYFAAHLASSGSATFLGKSLSYSAWAALQGAYEVADNGSDTLPASLTVAEFTRTVMPFFGLQRGVNY